MLRCNVIYQNKVYEVLHRLRANGTSPRVILEYLELYGCRGQILLSFRGQVVKAETYVWIAKTSKVRKEGVFSLIDGSS
jgi:hypothetical protein